MSKSPLRRWLCQDKVQFEPRGIGVCVCGRGGGHGATAAIEGEKDREREGESGVRGDRRRGG